MELELQNIRGGYGSKLVLEDLSLHIPSGQITTLLGPNGSGKSTLLKIIARTLPPFSGRVLLDGKDTTRIPHAELARVMAVLPQIHYAPEELNVQELVEMGRFPHRGWKPFLSKHDHEVVSHVLQLTQLEDLRTRPVRSLSGGERQRAWIALTLAQEPQILLLDEPTTFLDICHQLEVIELVRNLNRTQGLTVVMVLHDLNLAASCSDTLVMLKDRRIRCAGSPAEVLTPQNLRDVFQIEAIVTQDNGRPHCIAQHPARSSKEVSL